MFRFIKDILGTSRKQSDGFDSKLATSPTDVKRSLTEPMRIKRDIKVMRSLSRKATRMKLERILEKTEKRR